MKTKAKPPETQVKLTDILLGIAIPSTGQCRIEFATSLAKLLSAMTAVKLRPDVGKQQIILRMVQSSGISSNRELLARRCLADGCTHILFLDEDMSFDPMIGHRLMAHKKPIVLTNYRMRAKGGDFCAMSLYDYRIQTTEASAGLEQCRFAGFGVSLIAKEVFEAMPHPWFPIVWSEANQTYSTEDKSFFENARGHGFIPYIDHDASKAVGHVGSFQYLWNDNATGVLETASC